MDVNSKIIEGVKQYPSLYDNNHTLEERNRAWIQLAEKLKMHEQHLKIRWHCLLQRYQRDINFKYANKMNFLKRTVEVSVNQEENWPEFIITEEDLKDYRQDDREEFVFLDIDEEENRSKSLKQESDTEKNFHYNEQLQIDPSNSSSNKQNDEKSSKIFIQKVQTSNNCYEDQNLKAMDNAKQKPESPTNLTIIMENMGMKKKDASIEVEKVLKVNENAGKTTFEDTENISAAVQEPTNDEHGRKDFEEVVAQPSSTERCEDVIFGELVSAMLKRMDETKKKHIKKEIMNLLFS